MDDHSVFNKLPYAIQYIFFIIYLIYIIDGEPMETVRDFILWGSKITADGDCSHEIKRLLLFGRKVMTHLCMLSCSVMSDSLRSHGL